MVHYERQDSLVILNKNKSLCLIEFVLTTLLATVKKHFESVKIPFCLCLK